MLGLLAVTISPIAQGNLEISHKPSDSCKINRTFKLFLYNTVLSRNDDENISKTILRCTFCHLKYLRSPIIVDFSLF